jgi:hypothetical protein
VLRRRREVHSSNASQFHPKYSGNLSCSAALGQWSRPTPISLASTFYRRGITKGDLVLDDDVRHTMRLDAFVHRQVLAPVVLDDLVDPLLRARSVVPVVISPVISVVMGGGVEHWCHLVLGPRLSH